MQNILKITHNAGFFSCCSIKLLDIINYFNTNKEIPLNVDSSSQFILYKPDNITDDITYYFFQKNDDNYIKYIKDIEYHIRTQFDNYNTINYEPLLPFIDKYFTPSIEILNIKNNLIKKYNFDPEDNYCAVYYRGTDKKSETIIGTYDIYINKMIELKEKYKNIKFIIQSDETLFINTITSKFENCLVFDENITSNTDKGIHFDNDNNENFKIIKFFFAILLIMSKCKYIICSSGNCSIWMMFYRRHAYNVYQFLNNVWI